MRVLVFTLSLMSAIPVCAGASVDCEVNLAHPQPLKPWAQILEEIHDGFSVVAFKELESNEIVFIRLQDSGYFGTRIPYLFERDKIALRDLGALADISDAMNRWRPGLPMRLHLAGEDFLMTDRPILEALRSVRAQEVAGANPPSMREWLERNSARDPVVEFADETLVHTFLSDPDLFRRTLLANLDLALPGVQPGSGVLAVGQPYINEQELLRVYFSRDADVVTVHELTILHPGDRRDFLQAFAARNRWQPVTLLPSPDRHPSWSRFQRVFVDADTQAYIALANGIGRDQTLRILNMLLRSPREGSTARSRATIALDGRTYTVSMGPRGYDLRVKNISLKK